MRFTAFAITLLLVPFVARGDDKDKPISPEEAAKRVNEKCIVEMEVKSAGTASNGQLTFLNSEPNFRDEKNFTIFIDKDATEKFKKAKIEDIAAHFKGKKIRVRGTVTLYEKRPQIKIEEPEQIQIVEKK